VCGRAEQGNQPLLCGRAFRGRHLGADLFFETFGSEGLAALPGAGVAGDLLMLMVERDGRGIGFDGEFGSDVARRYAVAVTVEGQPDIFVDQRLDRLTVIGQQRWQRAERFGSKAFVRLLTGFAVLALVGHFFQPLPCLRIDVRQIGEATPAAKSFGAHSRWRARLYLFPRAPAHDRHAE
jgi:hypothetical protein